MEEITAEYSVDDLAPSVPLRRVPRITVACKTDLGRVRENNEDKFEYFLPEDDATLATKGLVFVVCDGMGGHAAGQIASELASKTFLDVYLNHAGTEPLAASRSAVIAANRFVHDVSRTIPGRSGMGTTLSALALVQDVAVVTQVGDSRVYRLREGMLEPLTQDHTYINEMVASGALTLEQAASHPNRHMLTRAIGVEAGVEPDIRSHDLQVGDVFFLCSDGILNHVDDEAIGRTLRECTPSAAVWKLISMALAGGGSDNATALVVRVDGLEERG